MSNIFVGRRELAIIVNDLLTLARRGNLATTNLTLDFEMRKVTTATVTLWRLRSASLLPNVLLRVTFAGLEGVYEYEIPEEDMPAIIDALDVALCYANLAA